MQPLDFAHIVNRCKKLVHYALTTAMVLFGIGALFSGAALGLGYSTIAAGLICVSGCVGTVALGNKLQQVGLLERPADY